MIPNVGNLIAMAEIQTAKYDELVKKFEDRNNRVEKAEARVNEVASQYLKSKRKLAICAEFGGIAVGTLFRTMSWDFLNDSMRLAVLVGTVALIVFTVREVTKEIKVNQILNAHRELHYNQAFELMEKKVLTIEKKDLTIWYTCVNDLFSVKTKKEVIEQKDYNLILEKQDD